MGSSMIIKFLCVVCTLVCFQSCYSSIPSTPPCFSDGNEPQSDPTREGATTIAKCCLSNQDCVDRFNAALSEGVLKSTNLIIKRFSYCEPLAEEVATFEDLTDEYGTCILNARDNNSECRIGIDCPGSDRCCPATGAQCNEKFGDDINNCTLCVEGECDVL